jgi:hypothetical protein
VEPGRVAALDGSSEPMLGKEHQTVDASSINRPTQHQQDERRRGSQSVAGGPTYVSPVATTPDLKVRPISSLLVDYGDLSVRLRDALAAGQHDLASRIGDDADRVAREIEARDVALQAVRSDVRIAPPQRGQLSPKATCPPWCLGHSVDECSVDGYDGICLGPTMGAGVEVYAESATGEIFVDAEGALVGPDLTRLNLDQTRSFAAALDAAASWLGEHR